MQPIEIRAEDKHETLLCRVDKQGIYVYNNNKREEVKLTWDEIKEILEEN